MTARATSGMFVPRDASHSRHGLGSLRWSPGARRRQHRRSRERGHRPHRAERRGQDDAVQRDHRTPAARPAAPSRSTAATSRTRSRTSGPGSVSAARSNGSRRSARSSVRDNVLVAAEMRHGCVAREVQARRPRRRADRAHRAHVGGRTSGSTSCPPARSGSSRLARALATKPKRAPARRAVVRAQRARDRRALRVAHRARRRPVSASCSSSTTWAW